ncbi:MAG: HesB/IscA family protein [Pseudobdellovibrionaceae bacterium]
MIIVSQSAAKKLAVLKEEEGKPEEAFLRVEVKKGGCSGLSYKMDFDVASREGDKFFEHNGQKVAVDPQSILYLMGMTLEYYGGLNGRGFVFNNPNATKNCGCGTSFNV